MAHKRPFDAVAPEQEAAPSPRKRLRRAVFIVMFLRSDRSRARAAAVTGEQMEHVVRQVLAAWLGSMEERLFRELPGILRGLSAEQLGAFPRSFVGSKEDTVRPVLQKHMQEPQRASHPNGADEPSISRSVMVSMEEKIRSVRQKQMQEPQPASFPNGVYESSSSRVIPQGLPESGGSSGVVRLRFVGVDRPEDPLFTRCPVEWQNGENPKVAIFLNEKQITGGDLSKLQIEILSVNAEFFTERGQDDFTEEEFNKHIHMCKGQESVLTTVNMRNGEADLGCIIFKESSYRQKLRLAARVKRQDLRVRVQEAITYPFVVKDRRSELNAKSNCPSKGDAIHQLRKISQKGKHWIALTEKKITTVKHLLRQYHKDKTGLQKLTGMKKEAWSTMINHATTCDPGEEIYSYRVAEGELLFNDFYYLVGMMMNGTYVPVRDLEQFPQHTVNNWKMSAYEKFEERENSGGLIPDYVMCKFNGRLMINGRPVCAVPLNNDAGPSIPATTILPYPNNMAAKKGVGLTGQHNGYLSSLTTDAPGTSCPVKELGQHDRSMPQNGNPYYPTQEKFVNCEGPFSGQPTVPSQNFLPVSEDDLIPGASLIGQQNGSLNSLITDTPELGQHHPFMSQNGSPCYLTRINILNDQGSFSGQPTIPSHGALPVREEDMIAGASPTGQQNGYLGSLVTDVPGTSCPVTDGLSLGTSSFNNATADIWSGFSPTELQEFLLQVNFADQDIVHANNELPNSNFRFDGYEHDDSNP
ncbi:uncharacterized protein [Lolium perenne]|uniref:uncharacterized protein isoform X2 n=1 Tax=Lolium perenne TaxID=4522 RepID=UPI0021F58471|nr:uncharacterized protein LOC127292595 isoform X2 [Lolium perenne]